MPCLISVGVRDASAPQWIVYLFSTAAVRSFILRCTTTVGQAVAGIFLDGEDRYLLLFIDFELVIVEYSLVNDQCPLFFLHGGAQFMARIHFCLD